MVARKLPSELEEEILIRVPLLSLVRFRAVCKEWNALFNDKRFVNKQLACSCPEFMLQTISNIYSISVNLNDDPDIKVRELTFDHHGKKLVNCDGYFFFYDNDHSHGAVAWNPWLRQTRCIPVVDKPFWLCGIGYDGTRPEKSYKVLGFTDCSNPRFAMFEFETNAWKFIDHLHYSEQSLIYHNVSLNGNLYWTAYNLETDQYFIRSIDFSKEIMKPFCILPCKKKDWSISHALAVYKGDRFSLLEQCYKTRKIKIWVTKTKISNGADGDDVVWIKFMTISIPNFPRFDHYSSSYLVDNNIFGKSFVMCCSDETCKACIYIVRGDLCKKIKVVDHKFDQFRCSVYVPSLINIS